MSGQIGLVRPHRDETVPPAYREGDPIWHILDGKMSLCGINVAILNSYEQIWVNQEEMSEMEVCERCTYLVAQSG